MTYGQIKDYISDIKNKNDKQNLNEISLLLTSDKRKNVISLGQKLINEKIKLDNEIKRVTALYDFDRSFLKQWFIAGVDEVGRGPLAGPIVGAAVVLDLDVKDSDLILGLNDSKKLSEKRREEIAEVIKQKAVAYKISEISNKVIDEKGIAYANNKVFLDSCNSLSVKPKLVLSDGYAVKHIDIANQYVIKGDTKSASIAAASIIAKVYRDNLMKEYAKVYPCYKFDSNAGYGSKEHIDAIKNNGITEIHRKSFLTRII